MCLDFPLSGIPRPLLRNSHIGAYLSRFVFLSLPLSCTFSIFPFPQLKHIPNENETEQNKTKQNKTTRITIATKQLVKFSDCTQYQMRCRLKVFHTKNDGSSNWATKTELIDA